MGKLFSKYLHKHNKNDRQNEQNVKQKNDEEEEEDEIDDPEKYDVEAVDCLKTEFKEDPEMFVLNMLLMSFMFFDDYQKEISKLANSTSERGKKLNLELVKEHQKQILMPDSVLERVNKRVKILPGQGSDEKPMQPLGSQRMFVLDDAIEIEDKNVVVGYSRIDKPLYRGYFEESKNHKDYENMEKEHRGYVKVNLLEILGKKLRGEKRSPSVDSACSTSSSKSYVKESESSLNNNNGDEDNYSEIHGNDSGYSTTVNSESTYDYRRITAARIPKKLSILDKDIYTDASRLPSKCITAVVFPNEKAVADLDFDDETVKMEYMNRKREVSLFRTVYYLNSTEFMDHFRSNTFPNTLGEVLGFTEESIRRATSIADAIFCNTMDDMQWEIIPSISIPWPTAIATERQVRIRVTKEYKREITLGDYKWPTPMMVGEMNKLTCVVIPKGFMPKKGDNESLNFEWEIGFPKAERYLEFRMSHAQMRVYMYILIIHKHFIEPFTQKHGLSIDHIRTHMFWECEDNYIAWPEHRLGTKLKLVLETLYNCLCKSNLPHYFVNGKNILENIPRKYLLPAQDVIFRILETPLSYLLAALKHVRYASKEFYPVPDIEELIGILTKKSLLPHGANITILAQENVIEDKEARLRNNNHFIKRDKTDTRQEWNRRLLEQQRIEKQKKIKMENEKNLKNEERKSKGSETLNFSVKKRLVEDVQRQSLVLEFFIQHFLKIAERSFEVSSTNQTLFYLKQAWYLTKLLEDIELAREDAWEHQKVIKEEEKKCQIKQVKEPKTFFTPKRTSAVFGNDILQVKGRQINMAKLNKSYNVNMMVNEPQPSTSGIKKKTKRKYPQNKVTINEDKNVVVTEIHEPIPSTSGITSRVVPDKEQTVPIEIPRARTNKQMQSEMQTNDKISLVNVHKDIKEEAEEAEEKSIPIKDYTPNPHRTVSFNPILRNNSTININNDTDDISESTSL